MHLLNVFQTGKVITGLKYHSSSDCLIYSALDAPELATVPLSKSQDSFAAIPLPEECTGAFDFDIDPAGKLLAVALANGAAALISLQKQTWSMLDAQLFSVDEGANCASGFCRVYFLPYANQVCFAPFEGPVTFRVDVKRKKRIDWIVGVNQSCSASNGGETLCFHSNFDCRGFHRFHFAADEKKRAKPTHRFPFYGGLAGEAHFLPDGKGMILLTEGGGRIAAEIWDLEAMQVANEWLHEGAAHEARQVTQLESAWIEKVGKRYEYSDDEWIPSSILSPNGRHVYLLATRGETVRLLRVTTAPLALHNETPTPHGSFVTARCLLVGKDQAATAAADGSIALWQFEDDDIKGVPQSASVAARLRKTIREHPCFPDDEGVGFHHYQESLRYTKSQEEQTPQPVEPPPKEKTAADYLREAGSVSGVLAVFALHWRGASMYWHLQGGLSAAELQAIFRQEKLRNTHLSEEVEEKRSLIAINWAVRTFAPRWLELLGPRFDSIRDELSKAPAIDSWATLTRALPALEHISDELSRAVMELEAGVPTMRRMDLHDCLKVLNNFAAGNLLNAPWQGCGERVGRGLEEAQQRLSKPEKYPKLLEAVEKATENHAMTWEDAQEAGRTAAKKFARGQDPETLDCCVLALVTRSKFNQAHTAGVKLMREALALDCLAPVNDILDKHDDIEAGLDEAMAFAQRRLQTVVEAVKDLESSFFARLSAV